ncbi:RluA family pseudouridine synthase [Candidatus Saccharibacteria bacterium]|nr:RluA family pseudouridine synthase [Candidatus Saccharibacteria bacterium]
MRLDIFLAQKYPEYSRATFQKLIEAGRVEAAGQTVTSPSVNVAENDDIKVHFPHQKTFAKEIEDFAKNVIYEDDNVVVINKPAGVLTHMKGSLANEFTVADFVRSRITANDDSFTKSNRLGIVHRLDRGTSGVLIAAKNSESAKFLTKQFQDRKAKKTYIALVAKAPKVSAAHIDLPIGRNPKKPAEFRIDPKGKSAITDYKTLEVFDDGSALVELKPLTGRTHQLRVHMAHIGAPIVGDVVYGRAGGRMFLHAAELEITIPRENDNERKAFMAPLPNDFQAEIERRRKSK